MYGPSFSSIAQCCSLHGGRAIIFWSYRRGSGGSGVSPNSANISSDGGEVLGDGNGLCRRLSYREAARTHSIPETTIGTMEQFINRNVTEPSRREKELTRLIGNSIPVMTLSSVVSHLLSLLRPGGLSSALSGMVRLMATLPSHDATRRMATRLSTSTSRGSTTRKTPRGMGSSLSIFAHHPRSDHHRLSRLPRLPRLPRRRSTSRSHSARRRSRPARKLPRRRPPEAGLLTMRRSPRRRRSSVRSARTTATRPPQRRSRARSAIPES